MSDRMWINVTTSAEVRYDTDLVQRIKAALGAAYIDDEGGSDGSTADNLFLVQVDTEDVHAVNELVERVRQTAYGVAAKVTTYADEN